MENIYKRENRGIVTNTIFRDQSVFISITLRTSQRKSRDCSGKGWNIYKAHDTEYMAK